MTLLSSSARRYSYSACTSLFYSICVLISLSSVSFLPQHRRGASFDISIPSLCLFIVKLRWKTTSMCCLHPLKVCSKEIFNYWVCLIMRRVPTVVPKGMWVAVRWKEGKWKCMCSTMQVNCRLLTADQITEFEFM